MQTRTEVLTGALNAITARVDGRFDDPDLAQFGPLQESIHGDCREIARIALQKAAALPMPSTTVSQAMEFESAAALLTSKGFTWQGEQWQIPRWNRVASAADTGAAVEIGRRLPALPPILDDYEAASSAMRRANRLAKHLYFLPHLCFLVFTPLGIYLNIKASNSDGIDFIAGITLFLGLAGLVGSLSPNQEGPLDELNAAQFQELSRIASENYLVAEWLAAAFDAGKTLRLRDLEAAQHHNSNLWRIRQDVKHRTELEVARADLSKTAHEHSTLAQETRVCVLCRICRASNPTITEGSPMVQSTHPSTPITLDEAVARIAELEASIQQASSAPYRPAMPDVDTLANVIRKVDGAHSLGAGALAEAILARLEQLESRVAPKAADFEAAVEVVLLSLFPGEWDKQSRVLWREPVTKALTEALPHMRAAITSGGPGTGQTSEHGSTVLLFSFPEAVRLLASFGGENAEITVQNRSAAMVGNQRFPAGLYAHVSDYPEEGAVHLGEHDPDSAIDLTPIASLMQR